VNPLFLHVSVKVGLLVVLLGIFVRRRYSECWSFPVYVLAVLVTETIVALYPERLFRWDVWICQQFLFDLCKLAVAIELSRRAFMVFPTARTVARAGWALVIAITTLSVAAATPDRVTTALETYQAFVFSIEPRLVNATIWLFVITARLVVFFNIPWSDWHRAISLGFAVYLLVFSTGLNLERRFAWGLQDLLNRVEGTAYLALTVWWAYAAWRRDDGPALPPSLLRPLAAGSA
jgi:hypothetical protein